LSNGQSLAAPTSSSAQLSASSSDNGVLLSTSSPSNSQSPKHSQDPRKPPSLAISPARSASLPTATAAQSANSAASAVPVSQSTVAEGSSQTFSVSDIQAPNSALPSTSILLTPATPAPHSGPNGVTGSFVPSSTSYTSAHPQVIVQSASIPSSEGLSTKPESISLSHDDLTPPSLHNLSRDSHVSLPEETKRYYASLVDSPMPSPQFSSTFPTSQGDSLDKLSPLVPQRRAESPLKQVQVAPDTAAEQLSADRRAINHPVGDSEFLDLDADDTDTTSPYDSVDDSGRASAVDSFDRPDDVNDHLEGLSISRKKKQREVVEDFPLPPNTPPVVKPGNDEVFATYQADMPALPHSTYSSRMHTSSSEIGGASQGSDARSLSSSHHDLSDSRTLASQSQVSLPPPHAPAQDNYSTKANAATKPPTFRSLPLLPADLPQTTIQVAHSSIRPNDRGKDVLSFIITVDPGNGKECWNIEKLYSDVLTLDARIRAMIGKSMSKKLVSLPEGRLWRDHAPARVDQRKVRSFVRV
jgi:RalA-binding protein 1